MQRNEKEIAKETPEVKTYKTYKESKPGYAAHEAKDMISQLLMWAVPLVLVGLLGYYLYQAYYSAPAVTHHAVETVKTVAEPVKAAAETMATPAKEAVA